MNNKQESFMDYITRTLIAFGILLLTGISITLSIITLSYIFSSFLAIYNSGGILTICKLYECYM